MAATLSLVKLINRKLVRISGPDCYPYLQGLFCNDLRYLYEPQRVPIGLHANVSSSVISSFMLNAQGRCICDVILYRTPRTRYECSFTPPGKAIEHDELLIECDAELASGLANTLYGYRVRRKVNLEILPDQQVWCLYPNLKAANLSTTDIERHHGSRLMMLKSLKTKQEMLTDDLTIVSDPRVDLMGLRILSKTSSNSSDIIEALLNKFLSNEGCNISESTVKDYTIHRYELGLGEGAKDHPEGNCLPLECNADYTNSVSFDKGCYLGQELTARIHYTGVVRKRLMPTRLDMDGVKLPLVAPLVAGSDIVDEKSGKKLGVLRHVVRDYALALLRTDLLTADTKLLHEATKVKMTTWRPYWWNLGS